MNLILPLARTTIRQNKLLKYYQEKANDISMELLNMNEVEIALSTLKTVEEDLNVLNIDWEILYYKYRTFNNIAHIWNM